MEFKLTIRISAKKALVPEIALAIVPAGNVLVLQLFLQRLMERVDMDIPQVSWPPSRPGEKVTQEPMA